MTAAGPAEPGVVVVTGGCSGIGLATSTRLAADGFTVAVLDIRASRPPRSPWAVTSPTRKTSRPP
jgi:NAD(P)-dependent dehydrogenase (short-subunit alcohol dehydrogenase family)